MSYRPLAPPAEIDNLTDVRNLIYSVYERRLNAKLAGAPHPRHVGVMVDGNRRWAKEMGKSMSEETGEELPEDFEEMVEKGTEGEGDED